MIWGLEDPWLGESPTARRASRAAVAGLEHPEHPDSGLLRVAQAPSGTLEPRLRGQVGKRADTIVRDGRQLGWATTGLKIRWSKVPSRPGTAFGQVLGSLVVSLEHNSMRDG